MALGALLLTLCLAWPPVAGATDAASRLSSGQAEQIAASDPSLVLLLVKHPELERSSFYDGAARVWTVNWTNPLNQKILIAAEVDDYSGALQTQVLENETYLDFLPLLGENEATELARNLPRIQDKLQKIPEATSGASIGSDRVWTVSFYDGSNEAARVLIDDVGSTVKEVMVGPQVAWQMARGYKGAFGRIVNEPYIWLPLSLLFILPFINLRSPLKLINLDLLMLLSFSVSHYFFNQGEIYRSVPLAYLPLAYLLARLFWIGLRDRKARSRPGGGEAGWEPPQLNFSPRLLLVGLVTLVVLRLVLNLADSNVVDVGYSGVIGAERISSGLSPYGNMSADNEHGDTYGPVNYLLYVPFERLLPWSGAWDDLYAAHAAAIAFDLLTIAGLFAAGRVLAANRVAGNILGLALAYAWAAFPYTTFVQNCNVNDTIVAAFLVWGFVLINRILPLGAIALALATQIKFFPALLLPLWLSFPHAWRGGRQKALFVIAFAAAGLAVMPIVFLGEGSLGLFWERTLEWQLGRDSPFSIWGQYPERLKRLQQAGQLVLAAAALLVYGWPRRKNAVQLAALSAALIVAFQALQTHWFYLYIPWFLPLALIAFLTRAGNKQRSLFVDTN